MEKLSVLERLILVMCLKEHGPRTGNISTCAILEKLLVDLGFSEEEHALLNFQKVDNGLKWDNDDKVVKEVKIGPVGRKSIKASIEEAMKAETDWKEKFQYKALYVRFGGEWPDGEDKEDVEVEDHEDELRRTVPDFDRKKEKKGKE